jgi:hypothetical protein
LLLLDGRIANMLGEPERARQSMRQAAAEAQAQDALWLQLIAGSALCAQEGASDDLKYLRHTVEQLNEGLDSAPVARARALIKAPRTPLSRRRSGTLGVAEQRAGFRDGIGIGCL